MDRRAVKPIVLILIFFCALVTFSMTTNKENEDLTASMSESTLPVIHFVYNDTVLNELHGYLQEMDMVSMRDSVQPIGKDRVLKIEMLTYGASVGNLSYEIRSMDGKRLLMEDDHVVLKGNQDKLSYEIQLPSLFDEQEEYHMILKAEVDNRPVYYYTRIIRADNCYADESLAFALKFHDYTFRDDAGSFIPTYMDPATGDPTKLSYVDLTCTLRQITWAKFTGTKLTEPVASFKEINNSYNVVTLNYVMTNINESNETEFYNVEEYYRIRHVGELVYVLNFERRMNQIFRGENDFFQGNSAIMLGIRDNEVQYLANDSGNCIAFVQEGELWCYDRINNSMAQVFSFRDFEGVDARENWAQHDIRIMRVDEAGSIEFLVYGYMNRGVHEGNVGIGVYHYDGIAHTVEEEMFIATDKSYEALKGELGELMYINEQKQLYLMINADIYQTDLNTGSTRLYIDLPEGEGYAISGDSRYVAWIEEDGLYSSTSIRFMDLKTGKEQAITSGTDTYLKPLAFIGGDFIYGVANIADVKIDVLGNISYPMGAIEILTTAEDKLNLIKTYHPLRGFVGDVTIADKNIRVELVEERNGRLVNIGSDTIMNRETSVANKVELTTTVTDIKQTQIAITMKSISDTKGVKVVTSKHVLVDEAMNLPLVFGNKEPMYYVYAKGNVLMATTKVSAAILCANENAGVVVDNNLKYIYKRARANSYTAIKGMSLYEGDGAATAYAKCISAILMYEEVGLSVKGLMEAGQTPADILRTTLSGKTVLELEDCKVDEVLYYINLGHPVFARTGNGEAILLTGYTSSRIHYYDPNRGQIRNVDYEEMEAMLYNGGNYFIVYIE